MLKNILGNKPSFRSAMSLFTKAKDELDAANELNELELAEAQKKVETCAEEKANIARATNFLNSILGIDPAVSAEVAEEKEEVALVATKD